MKNERLRFVPRYFALGMLSLPLLVAAGCGTASDSDDGYPICTTPECDGAGGYGTGATLSGTGGTVGTGGFVVGAGGFIVGAGGIVAAGGIVGAGGDVLGTGGVVGAGGTGGDVGVGGQPGAGGILASGGSVSSGGTASGGTSSGGSSSGGSGGSSACTDIQAPDHPGEPCSQWLEWGICDDQWMIDGNYCNATCGRCALGTGGTSGTGGVSSGGTGGASSGGASGTGGVSTGGTSSGGASGTGGVSTGGTGSGGTGGTSGCSDIMPPGSTPCSDWKNYGQCGSQWFLDNNYCASTCGMCTGSGGATGSGGTSSGGATGTGGTSSGGTSSGGSTGTGGSGGVTLPDVGGNKTGWASRYWDCCKPSCAWSGQVDSCQANGTSVVDKNEGSKCANQGNAYVCNSDAPRALSSTVSYGYVAQPSSQLQCGVCYHIQFTGASHNAGNDPGSQSLSGKHMIVRVSNNGGDVAGDQLDLMIPGGGVGANASTCGAQWGASSSDLGAQYGGFLTTCKQQSNDYNTYKSCVKSKCNSVVPAGTLRDSCNWFVDWYGAADNPAFKIEQTTCPNDI